MRNKHKNSYGVITVMISLMLTGILSMGTIVVEAGRLQGARTQLDDANLSAGTSMIASYDSELYDRYGLLAIDNETFNIGRYREYLDFNSDRAAGYKGNNISTFYTIESAEIEGMYNLTYPSVLKRQILSRAKLNVVPQDFSLNYYNMDYFLSDFQAKTQFVSDFLKPVCLGRAEPGSEDDIPDEMKSALVKLNNYFGDVKRYDEEYNVTLTSSDMSLLPSFTGTAAHSVPSEDLDAITEATNNANTVLGDNSALLSSISSGEYTEIDVTLNTTFTSSAMGAFSNMRRLSSNAVDITKSCTRMVQGVNAAINMLKSDDEGNLLLNSYIVANFPNKNFVVEGYAGPKKGTAVSGVNNATFTAACVEYIFTGAAKETVNQQAAYNYIIATRFVSNLHSTILNSPYIDRLNATSVAAHIAWAYYETCADAELLFRYNACVPLNKYNMILPINNISGVNNAFSSNDFLTAMSTLGILNGDKFIVDGYDETTYKDALALALWFVPNSKKIRRISDLIQLEMRYREQHIDNSTATFLMSEQNTFCRVKCVGSMNSMLPVISLGSDGDIDGTRISSIKYVGF